MVPTQITHEIFVAASREQVWSLLTEPEQIAKWFAFDGAEIDLRPGGILTMTWKEHGVYTAIIEVVEPLHTFAYRWARLPGEQPGPGNSTLVTFTIHPEADGVRLQVTESGFQDLDLPEAEQAAWAADNQQGWQGGFATLLTVVDVRELAAHHNVGSDATENHTIVRDIMVAAPVERVWDVLTDPEHVASWFGERAEIDPRPGGAAHFEWEDHGVFRAIVVRFDPPSHFAYRWGNRVGDEPVAGTSTLVEFTLEPAGEGTRLRVVESGFETLNMPDDAQRQAVEENIQGWRSELDELRAYTEQLSA